MNVLRQSGSSVGAPRVRNLFWILAIVLGWVQAWESRRSLVNDTVSYLDIGDALGRGHWSAAVNGVWSPLYCVIVGAANRVFRPSAQWEYPLVHILLFVVFLVALAGFDFFLREVLALRQEQVTAEHLSLSNATWITLGYVLFLWASLQLIEVAETNPDMLVAAFFFIACGLLVRIHRGAAGWPAHLALGLVLGLAYLTKSVMFVVSLFCLAPALVTGRRHLTRLLAAIAVFVIAGAPFAAALSAARGRLTFGDSGLYNYAVHVGGLPAVHWQGEPPALGQPIHPTRQILAQPAAFEFAGPIGGTYPAWTDPSYWYQGVRMRPSPRLWLGSASHVLRDEALFLFYSLNGSLLASLFVLFFVAGRRWSTLRDISAYWFLVLPAAATLLLYGMIHFELRYIAPFVVVLALCLFLSVRLPASQQSRALFLSLIILISAMASFSVITTRYSFRTTLRDVLGHSRPDPDSPQEVAAAMSHLGMKPGDRIASLEWSLYGMSTWARLARVQIIAEVYFCPQQPETLHNDFWRADEDTQQKLIGAFARTGADYLVSHEPPTPAASAGWVRAGETSYYVYSLRHSPAVRN